MRVLSVNVGLPREVRWRGKLVTTGIYKQPVEGRLTVRTLNLDGDRQADLRVHGGWDKAVYAYPSEYYELWRQERPELEFPWRSTDQGDAVRAVLDHASRRNRGHIARVRGSTAKTRLFLRTSRVRYSGSQWRLRIASTASWAPTRLR